jgi:putative transposase
VLLTHVRSAFYLSNGTYGSPRMTRELQDQSLAVGRRRTACLVQDNGLRAWQKRRFKKATDSEHAWPIAPNLLDQDFSTAAPSWKWSADISYIWTREDWLYIAIVMDLFSRPLPTKSGRPNPKQLSPFPGKVQNDGEGSRARQKAPISVASS